MNRFLKFLSSALLVVLGSLSIACGVSSPSGVSYAPTSPPPPTVQPTGPLSQFRDGSYEIGTAAGQIPPGKYKTIVPSDSRNCYWERQKGLSGTLDDITANDNLKPGSPVIVQITTADKGFKTFGCGEWIHA
jgi:hypothetical protein